MEFTQKDKENLSKIVNGLEEFRKEILEIDYIHKKVEFFEIMKNFRKFLVSQDQEMYEVFLHSKYYKFYKDFFTDIHEYYLRSLESIQSLSVMTQGVHNFNSLSEVIDKDLLKESFIRKSKEIEPVDFTNVKNFVFAGCGPFPETMLYVYENTNVENILGLDYNHEAIYMAGEMINGLGMENINFKHIDATKYDYSDSDVVSIPLFVPLKKEVINQILETGKDSVQIMVTIPKGFLNLIYEGLGESLSPRGKITYRKEVISDFVNEEILKIEKYDF